MDDVKANTDRIHKANSKFLHDRWLNFKKNYEHDVKTGKGRIFQYVPKGKCMSLREDEVLDIDNYLKDYELELESRQQQQKS